MNREVAFKSFMEALVGSTNTADRVPKQLSSISEANLTVARELVELTKKLERDGHKDDAEALKKNIVSLLDNNNRLIQTLKYTSELGI